MRWARPGGSPGRGLPVLLLALLLLRGGCLGEDPLFHPDWGFESYEITTPTRLSPQGGQRAAGTGQVSYHLHVRGERRVLQLRPKRLLLPRDLRVFSFTKRGHVVEDHPYIPRDCNYRGVVEGVQDSEATVSTCMGGLRGVLQLHGAHYQIEPLVASPTSEHVVYLLKKEGLSLNHTCVITDDGDGDGDDETERQGPQHEDMARARDFIHSYKHTKYLELVVVLDHSRFLYSKANLTKVISDGIIMAGIMDTFFQEINMRIHLSALEVWTDKDKIKTDGVPLDQVTKDFVQYKKVSVSPRHANDWAHLFMEKNLRRGPYNTPNDLMSGYLCSPDEGGSLTPHVGNNLLLAVAWATHVLGHVLKMNHDTPSCECRGRHQCLMGTGATGFSNCSYADFVAYISEAGNCLNNIPQTGFVFQRCGNKILEGDEECDCGTPEDCKKDPCCQPDCKLRKGAICNSGLCCHNCRFRPSGYMCRKEDNECDLPEYCNGRSESCPHDFYKQDGTPCRYEGVCFRKGCRSRYMQCQSIFGPDAREAPHQCYEAVNTVGDQYGNCKIHGMNSYEKCTLDNSICGRIQCINVKSLPSLPDHSTIISTHLEEQNLMCWGLGYHFSMVPMGLPDVGVVSDGTSCGKNRVCLNKTCVSVSVLQFDCFYDRCSYRGVCNNRKHCHCMYGWAPPYCEDEGSGGSVDSGPPRSTTENVFSWIRVLAFLLLRLLCLGVSVIIVFYKETIKQILKRDKQEESALITDKGNNENMGKPEEKTPRAEAVNLSEAQDPIATS